MASGHWESYPMLAGHRHLSVLACVIKGKCIWMILEFKDPTCVDPMWPVGLPPVLCSRGLSTLLVP